MSFNKLEDVISAGLLALMLLALVLMTIGGLAIYGIIRFFGKVLDGNKEDLCLVVKQ
jgi:hypothetical protein